MENDTKLTDDLAASITAHSFDNHAAHFRDERSNGSPNKPSESRGPRLEINEPADLKNHVIKTLNDPNTLYFTDAATGRAAWFNTESRTMLVFNPAQYTQGDGNFGTAMRSKVRLGDREFESILDKIEASTGNRPIVHQNDGKWIKHIEKHADNIHLSGIKARQWSDTFSDIGKKGGPIAGIVIGGGVAGATLLGGASPAEAAETFYETAVPYGETQIELARGNPEAAARAATIEAASDVGCAVGGTVLGVGGFIAGTPAPGVGNAALATAGAVGGCAAGGIATGMATEFVIDNGQAIKDGIVEISGQTVDAVKRGYNAVIDAGADAIVRAQEFFSRPGADSSAVLDASGKPVQDLMRVLPPQDTPGISPETQSLSVYADGYKNLQGALNATPATEANATARQNLISRRDTVGGLFTSQLQEVTAYDGMQHVGPDVANYQAQQAALAAEQRRQLEIQELERMHKLESPPEAANNNKEQPAGILVGAGSAPAAPAYGR